MITAPGCRSPRRTISSRSAQNREPHWSMKTAAKTRPGGYWPGNLCNRSLLWPVQTSTRCARPAYVVMHWAAIALPGSTSKVTTRRPGWDRARRIAEYPIYVPISRMLPLMGAPFKAAVMTSAFLPPAILNHWRAGRSSSCEHSSNAAHTESGSPALARCRTYGSNTAAFGPLAAPLRPSPSSPGSCIACSLPPAPGHCTEAGGVHEVVVSDEIGQIGTLAGPSACPPQAKAIHLVTSSCGTSSNTASAPDASPDAAKREAAVHAVTLEAAGPRPK
mmetsp:Transcript_91544/g.267887  ORF Transcript_91544/g.267887 Transcript_91544/m.267887 type:complete len:276 (+) Transcript_91544:304-1131(+)